ncbi:MAG: cysteine desulfurase [Minicystis sp.]
MIISPSEAPRALDPARIRDDFPALAQHVHGRPLVYLDSASTAQKPRIVVEAVRRMLEEECANIHRGVHALSVAATDRYEAARETVRRFLGAEDAREIVFTRGTTESINLVAQSFGRKVVGPGDRVVVSMLEHHSNLVPWQMLCAERGAELVAIPLDARGLLDLDRLDTLINARTKIVALSQVSNALGTITPLAEIIPLARGRGAAVLVDGAQAVPHLRVDVRALDCDFYCFSGHKLYGPPGTGVLYGKRARLAAMPPWQGGGDMILSVTLEKSTYAEPPQRFEAGTPNIAGIVGMAAAIDYVEGLGLEAIAAHERRLLAHGTSALARVPGLTIIGASEPKTALFSFVLPGIHPHDLGTFLDDQGIAVRTGHHCAEPLMRHFNLSGTTRASLALHTTTAELDALAQALIEAVEMFR